jgi:hypothetical protein
MRGTMSYITGRPQAKEIWKKDSDVNFWTQMGSEWGVEEASQWGTS